MSQFVFSIDFEDWYQGIEIPHSNWHKYEARIHIGCEKILKLLDSQGIKATFFVLGKVAEDHPHLIEKIAASGHELGTHGYYHQKIYNLTPKTFAEQLGNSIKAIESISGSKVIGHRAPYFSITKDSLWALEILKDFGIEYDSSVFPGSNWRYGISDAPSEPYFMEEHGLWQFPVSVGEIFGKRLGIGGAYFRILPYSITKSFLKKKQEKNEFGGFYLHPWELDPEHPIVSFRYRAMATHYFNLGAMEPRLKKLVNDFHFISYKQYLSELNFDRGVAVA